MEVFFISVSMAGFDFLQCSGPSRVAVNGPAGVGNRTVIPLLVIPYLFSLKLQARLCWGTPRRIGPATPFRVGAQDRGTVEEGYQRAQESAGAYCL
jgi:hypothetical protein